MRQIDQIIGTKDAQHILALCTDGGIMYFNRSDANLIEFQSLQREINVDKTWNLNRIGDNGEVVLLRAMKPIDCNYSVIEVNTLASLTSDDISKESLLTYNKNWNNWGYYNNSNTKTLQTDINVTTVAVIDPVLKPVVSKPLTEVIRKPILPKSVTKSAVKLNTTPRPNVTNSSSRIVHGSNHSNSNSNNRWNQNRNNDNNDDDITRHVYRTNNQKYKDDDDSIAEIVSLPTKRQRIAPINFLLDEPIVNKTISNNNTNKSNVIITRVPRIVDSPIESHEVIVSFPCFSYYVIY